MIDGRWLPSDVYRLMSDRLSSVVSQAVGLYSRLKTQNSDLLVYGLTSAGAMVREPLWHKKTTAQAAIFYWYLLQIQRFSR